MNDGDQAGGQWRQRAITPGEIDPARSRFIDSILAKRRAEQAAEKPATESSSKRRCGVSVSPLLSRVWGPSGGKLRVGRLITRCP